VAERKNNMAAEAKKIIRRREAGATEFLKVTLFVVNGTTGGRRSSYGFPENLEEWLSEGMYDGDGVQDYTIVSERLEETAFKKELDALA